MADLATLQIKVDSRQAKQAQRDLRDLGFTASRTDVASQKLERTNRSLGSSFFSLTNIVRGFIGLQAARQFSSFADSATELRTRLGNVTDSAQEFNQVFDGLFGVAQRTGTSVGALADVYTKLNISLSESLRTQTDLVQVTEILSRGLAASGASAQTAAGALLQLTQGLATDFRAAGQELNSIIEGAPLLAKAIAIELGGNAAVDLKRFAEEGTLTSETFIKALLNAEDAVNAFEIPPTIGRSVQRLRNEFLKLITLSSSVEEASNSVASAIDGVADTVSKIPLLLQATEPPFFKFISNLRETAREARQATQYYREFIDTLPEDLSLAVPPRPSTPDNLTGEVFGPAGPSAPLPARNPLAGLADEDALKAREGVEKVYRDIEKAQKAANDNTNTSIDLTDDLSGSIRSIEQEVSRFANSSADAFSDFVSGTITARDALNQLLQDIQRFVIRKTITSPLEQAIGGFIDNFNFGGFNPATSAPPPKPNFATGGGFDIMGRSGIDNNVLALNGRPIANVSRGERLNIGKNGGQPVVNVNVVNNASGAQAQTQKGPNGDITVIIDDIVAGNARRRGTKTFDVLQNLKNSRLSTG